MILSEVFLEKLKHIRGETAALFCLQKEEYLWWLSIGDNSLYIFHKEFNELGQYRLNQRIFYQWVGEKNSLDLKVPCYTTGTIQLRQGHSRILLLTDGVLEIEGRPFENNERLAFEFNTKGKENAVKSILKEVETRKGRDSATMLTWDVRI